VTDVVPFVDLRAAHAELAPRLEDAVLRVARSGRYLFGPETEAFEREFAAYCGSEHCVTVGSGLAALELALRAAGIGEGDEVLVPAYTFMATWLGVSRAGARPVGVDVRADTYNVDPDRIPAAITERTAAIVPVHFRGEPADMERVMEIARSRRLLVLEDCAQAHGARRDGRRAGSIGDAGAFSFYPSKNLGALGDGGAVTTDDAGLADRVRVLRNYGSRAKGEFEVAGFNSRLPELQAAVLREKLRVLDEWNERRTGIAVSYRNALAPSDAVAIPDPDPRAEPVWHLFIVGHSRRDECREALSAEGVQTGIHYPVLPHLSAPYRADRQPRGGFPVAETLAASSFSLPMYPQLDADACKRVASILLRAS
jgi:dTDP-3-amino-3,4,6-trideoxy-alpha-D-glucose transaminase